MRFAAMCCVLLVMGCAGADGATGPQGPQGTAGATGPRGPGTRLQYSGNLDASGAVQRSLPLEAGTLGSPPTVTCYHATFPAGQWLVVGGISATSTGRCGIGQQSTGALYVYLDRGSAGAEYLIVVIY